MAHRAAAQDARSPRKQPRQDRSRATVEAVLTATSQVLVARGYAGLTTTEVARVAGVSVGSLYQYFPNKEAAVLAVLERYLDDLVASMAREVAAAGPSLEEQVTAALRGLLAAKARDPALSVALKYQLPAVGRDPRVQRVLRRSQKLVADMLAAHRAALGGLDLAWAAQVVVNAVDGVIASVLETAPRRLREPPLLRELCRLVLGYLHPPR